MSSQIVIVSGPPGAGKSSIARKLAENGPGALAVHLHTDEFYVSIRKGYVDPWLEEAHHQHAAVMQVVAAATSAYASLNYDVYVDGIIGSWYLDPWLGLADDPKLDVRYVVLRPSEQVTVDRAIGRADVPALKNESVIRAMCGFFANLGPLETHAFNSDELTAEETVVQLQERLAVGDFRLGK